MQDISYTDNIIEGLLELCHTIYEMLYNSAINMLVWYNTLVENIGYNPLQLMFGSAVVLCLGYILAKWIVDIWPG